MKGKDSAVLYPALPLVLLPGAGAGDEYSDDALVVVVVVMIGNAGVITLRGLRRV